MNESLNLDLNTYRNIYTVYFTSSVFNLVRIKGKRFCVVILFMRDSFRCIVALISCINRYIVKRSLQGQQDKHLCE